MCANPVARARSHLVRWANTCGHQERTAYPLAAIAHAWHEILGFLNCNHPYLGFPKCVRQLPMAVILQGCYGVTILLYVLLLMANLLLVYIVWVLCDCCTIMPSFTPTGSLKHENLVLEAKKFGICFVVSWLFILISKNLWLVFHLP